MQWQHCYARHVAQRHVTYLACFRLKREPVFVSRTALQRTLLLCTARNSIPSLKGLICIHLLNKSQRNLPVLDGFVGKKNE